MAIDFSLSADKFDEDDPKEIDRRAREIAAKVARAKAEAQQMVAQANAQRQKASLEEQVARLQADAFMARAKDMHAATAKASAQAQADALAAETKAAVHMLKATDKVVESPKVTTTDLSM